MIFGRVYIREIIRLGRGQSWTDSGHGLITGNEGLVDTVQESKHYVQIETLIKGASGLVTN